MDVAGDRRSWSRLARRGGWLRHAWELGQSLRPASRRAGRLLVVGSKNFEPWHATAHLADEALYSGLPEIRPTLLRTSVEPGAPPHLAHTEEELRGAGHGHAVLVVAPSSLTPDLLEHLSDARRHGATVFAVSGGEDQLAVVAHDLVAVSERDLLTGIVEPFDVASHLVAVSAGTVGRRRRSFFMPPKVAPLPPQGS